MSVCMSVRVHVYVCICVAACVGGVKERGELTSIQTLKKVFPQPKERDRSLPVPRGMTAIWGRGSRFKSSMVFKIHATVPSPPAANTRSLLQKRPKHTYQAL